MNAFNAMGNLVGLPPIMINEITLTLEHVMQRLDIIENKISTVEHVENLDKKIHNHITQIGSKLGITLKTIKEEPIIDERVEQSPARIDKLEEIITNLGSAFASFKTTPKFPPNKTAKFIYVPKNKGESSSKRDEDLKMISICPSFINMIKEPILTNEFLDFLPRSVIINKHNEIPWEYRCAIEELNTKYDKT